MGSGAKSYMRKGFLIHEEMHKYLTICEEAVSHIWVYNLAPDTSEFPNIWGKFSFLFYQCGTLRHPLSLSLYLWFLCSSGQQTDVVYLCWPIAPAYTSPNAGGGEVAGSQPMSAAVHITWHGAQINFGDLNLYGVQALRGRAVTPQLRAAREPPGGRESPPTRGGGGEGEGSLAPCLLAPRLPQPRLTTLPQARNLPCNKHRRL